MTKSRLRLNSNNMKTDETWAVVFDMDGTMVDNRAWHEQAWIEMGRRRGLPVTAEFYQQKLHSRGNGEIIRELFGSQVDEKFIRRFAEEKEAVYRDLYAPHVKEVSGLRTLLRDLNDEGVPCAVVSNSPRENVDFILSGLGVADCFRVILSADDVTKGKPDPELILKAAQRLGVPPYRCVVLEDSVSGFQAAEAAGALYVIVCAGADMEPVETFRDRAKRVVRDFNELNFQTLEDIAEGKNCE